MELARFLLVCRRLGSTHVSLFGSAVDRPLREVSNVDLHVVLPRMDGAAHEALREAAEEEIRAMARKAGRPWCVEVRHGPFKPPPAAERPLQIHLVADDARSLRQSPTVLLAHRAALGRRLWGSPLPLRPLVRAREAAAELRRWRGALVEEEIPYRHWVFRGAPRLVESRWVARSQWERACLLRGAAAAGDLFYFSSVPSAALDEAPMTAMVPRQPATGGRWSAVRDSAIAALDRRLRHLERR